MGHGRRMRWARHEQQQGREWGSSCHGGLNVCMGLLYDPCAAIACYMVPQVGGPQSYNVCVLCLPRVLYASFVLSQLGVTTICSETDKVFTCLRRYLENGQKDVLRCFEKIGPLHALFSRNLSKSLEISRHLLTSLENLGKAKYGSIFCLETSTPVAKS